MKTQQPLRRDSFPVWVSTAEGAGLTGGRTAAYSEHPAHRVEAQDHAHAGGSVYSLRGVGRWASPTLLAQVFYGRLISGTLSPSPSKGSLCWRGPSMETSLSPLYRVPIQGPLRQHFSGQDASPEAKSAESLETRRPLWLDPLTLGQPLSQAPWESLIKGPARPSGTH